MRDRLRVPTPDRILWIAEAFRAGLDRDEVAGLTRVDPWFLEQIRELVVFE